jgi:hypothetical protein
MKKLLIVTLLMITSIVTFSQEQPRVPFQLNPVYINGEMRMRGDQERGPQFGLNRPPFDTQRGQRMRGNFPQRGPQFGLNRPERIVVRGNKVIVIFDRKEFQSRNPKIINQKKWKSKLHKRTNRHNRYKK